MRLFLYGTLLDPAVLRRFAGRHLASRPATLRGWRRVAMRGGRYPTIVRSRAVLHGAVISVPAATLRLLEAYEGPLYVRRPVAARAGRGDALAFAWIAPAATRRPWP